MICIYVRDYYEFRDCTFGIVTYGTNKWCRHMGEKKPSEIDLLVYDLFTRESDFALSLPLYLYDNSVLKTALPQGEIGHVNDP